MTLVEVAPTVSVDEPFTEEAADPDTCFTCHNSGWVPIPEDWDYFQHCDCPAGDAESCFSAPALGGRRFDDVLPDRFFPAEDVEPPF